MGFHVNAEQFDTWLTEQQKTHDIYAPKCFPEGNTFSNMDCIRYGKVSSISEIVFDKKSEYSFKEVLTPISQTLFFFTEDQCKEADSPKKGAIIFLRSCDLHALKRLDDLYLHNDPADYYYKRIRDNIKIVLIGCKQSFESCFCVSMGTNLSENYDMSIDVGDGVYELNCKDAQWNQFFMDMGASRHLVVPDQVHENQTVVKIPDNLTADVARSTMWEQYNKRCIPNLILQDVSEAVAIVVDAPAMMRFSVKGLLERGLTASRVRVPGGKEHIGYIVDRTGFEEFNRWALKGVTLPDKAEVSQTMYWKGIKYGGGITMLDGCQGKPRIPTIIEKICPQCGAEIELFSIDTQMACEKCGFIAYNDTLSCVQWCQYARKCVGDEMYEHMMEIAAAQRVRA